MKTLVDELRKNNYNEVSLYTRAADKIEALEKANKEQFETILELQNKVDNKAQQYVTTEAAENLKGQISNLGYIAKSYLAELQHALTNAKIAVELHYLNPQEYISSLRMKEAQLKNRVDHLTHKLKHMDILP